MKGVRLDTAKPGDLDVSPAGVNADGSRVCPHTEREWRGPNWTCSACGHVARERAQETTQPREFAVGAKVADIYDTGRDGDLVKTVSRSYWQNYAGGNTADYTIEFAEGGWNKSSNLTPAHESTTQPGLYYWAQRVVIRLESRCWNVVAQATGYPATEAFDDWLANYSDADDIAQQLAKGEL